MSACWPCPEGSVNNQKSTKCECNKGLYARFSDSPQMTCLECKPGFNCDESGMTWEELATHEGFWRDSVDSDTIYRCLIPQHCTGGHNSTCGPNRQGPMCSQCMEGFTGAIECTSCGSEEVSIGGAVAIVLLALLALVASFFLILKLAQKQVERMEKLQANPSALRTIKQASTRHLDIHSDREHTTLEVQASIKNVTMVTTMASRRAPSFLQKVKILVSFGQIAQHIAFAGDIPWPKTFQAFASAFAIFNFNFLPWSSLQCVAAINHILKTWIVCIVPIGVLLLMLVFMYLPMRYFESKDFSDDLQIKKQRKTTLRKFYRLCTFVTFLFYPFVASTVLSMYNCITISGVSYLTEDMSIVCGSPQWLANAMPMLAFVAIYPLGVPMLYWYLLKKHSKQLHKPELLLQYGFLCEAFRNDCWYFELLDMLEKLMVMSLVPFLPNKDEMMGTMIVVGIYLGIILFVNPYVRKGDDRLQVLVQANLLLLALMGYTLQSTGKATLDSVLDIIISILLIALVGVMILTAFIMLIRWVVKE